ncbi:hypothetical protein C8Q70DRAFT_502312 [Cubamyces menziesii]|nr:hypothetical protein C8Q70DRAFT_502312 [Cubamyces menziesii]
MTLKLTRVPATSARIQALVQHLSSTVDALRSNARAVTPSCCVSHHASPLVIMDPHVSRVPPFLVSRSRFVRRVIQRTIVASANYSVNSPPIHPSTCPIRSSSPQYPAHAPPHPIRPSPFALQSHLPPSPLTPTPCLPHAHTHAIPYAPHRIHTHTSRLGYPICLRIL